ncbi:DUF1206 domain-containing protein [Sphingomonas suaedae]|uniref:DUF1206 domain-containing protein n=1 Tax=Sphingomonas suaedae TaxID=2599297 RepID=A0A518RDK0_9SPHN|nr:DUF1206 domain-containing protein [Sphingomonas suaedae]QDX25461.1 DUF1206 domain-containing protein [Sphingomonas suaedae]
MTASTRLTTLTRIGFATRGVLYSVIAYLVIRTGRAEGPGGALDYLSEGSGKVLLSVMAVGLLAYGMWRLADAALNIEDHEADKKGAMERAGAALSGLAHLFLTWQAIQLVQGVSSDGNSVQDSARTALTFPGGGVAILLAGAVVLVVGVVQLVRAWKGSFLRHLEPKMARRTWVKWSGRAGYAARGIVFLIVGYFLVAAGLDTTSSGVGGMDAALSWLESPVDVIVALGLFGFGIFSLVEARWRILQSVPVDRLT